MDFLHPQFREIKAFLTWLGRYDWLETTSLGNNKYITKPIPPPHLYEQPLGHWFDRIMTHDITTPTMYMFYVWSKYFAHGPKKFQPTFEQCMVMEQMEINIPSADYRQAYDVVQIQFPKEYIANISERFHFKCPDGMLCHRFDSHGGIIITSVDASNDKPDYMKLVPGDAQSIDEEIINRETMEDMLSMDNEYEWAMSEHLERVCINLNMLLSHHPTQLSIENPKREKVLTKQLTVPNRKARDKAKVEYDIEPKVITFTQQIKLFDDQRTSVHQGGTHNSPTPHWRKGHWRQQRFGIGRLGIKTIFIRPVLVNDQRFLGDMKDTSTTYRG